MTEYIERRDANDAVMDAIWHGKWSMYDVANAINSVPNADVAPVRHGRWVEKEKYTFGIMYDCSLCENRILDNGHPWNYCPNCGAKMDGDYNG